MIANDRLEGERQHAKNAVEEYVYEIRDKLYGEYEQYISDAVSHEVLSSINTLQDENLRFSANGKFAKNMISNH